MPNRNWISTTGKLASLAAVGAGAVSLTATKAEASIIVSDTLNTTIGFTSNTPPSSGKHVSASHVFNTFAGAGGPSFKFIAYGFKSGGGGSTTYRRSVQGVGVGFELRDNVITNVAAGAMMSGTAGNGFAVGARAWGSSSETQGSAFTDKYILFRFVNGATTDYGWIEASLTLTNPSNANASNGPNLTVLRYAFDTTGAKIAAGDTGAAAPEPSTLAEMGIGALILGAAGLRRLRKAQAGA